MTTMSLSSPTYPLWYRRCRHPTFRCHLASKPVSRCRELLPPQYNDPVEGPFTNASNLAETLALLLRFQLPNTSIPPLIFGKATATARTIALTMRVPIILGIEVRNWKTRHTPALSRCVSDLRTRISTLRSHRMQTPHLLLNVTFSLAFMKYLLHPSTQWTHSPLREPFKIS